MGNQFIDVNSDLIDFYQSLFEKSLHQDDKALLLNAISELITTWKELNALNEERSAFFISTSKKYL